MKRTLGIAKKGMKEKSIESDSISTCPKISDEIFRYLLPHMSTFRNTEYFVYDECAGPNAVLGRAVEQVLSRTHKVKLTHNDKFFGGIDALDCFIAQQDIIVCNPPWRLSEALPIFEKLRKNLAKNGVLFFLINNVFLYQGPARAEKLGFQKFYFLPRAVFRLSGRPLLDCGIAIYHANGRVPIKAASLPCYIPISDQAMGIKRRKN